MREKEQQNKEVEHKSRVRDGFTPTDKALHEGYITKDLGSKRNEELRVFIDKHITEFKGTAEPSPGIPLMLFERKQDAQNFADKLSAKLDIAKPHVAVKAQKYTR